MIGFGYFPLDLTWFSVMMEDKHQSVFVAYTESYKGGGHVYFSDVNE